MTDHTFPLFLEPFPYKGVLKFKGKVKLSRMKVLEISTPGVKSGYPGGR